MLLLSRRGSLFLRGWFSHAFFLEALRGLFDIVVVVVYIVIPKKIALRHLASIMIASSFDDFSMLLPFD